MSLIVAEKIKDILSYESDVWKSADVLRGNVGLKGSEFPDYMMPFFALRMVESRLIRAYHQISQDPELTTREDIIEEVKDNVGFYNSMIVEEGIILSDIIRNDKTFYSDFAKYLNSFDGELKVLLGVVDGDKTENLNISAVVDTLKKKGVLLGYVKAWAEVDFTPYDNAEITTLEEHIKRKWADMSAETAGEQYTPFDIIDLIARIISKQKINVNRPYRLYDMTCGGGNMVFGVEDAIRKIYPNAFIETYGQELRGALYALAKIESKFRKSAFIEHGNTLTNDKFAEKTFDFGVANPPYGVDWKEEKKTVENDESGRFGHGGYPSVSDGQLLFVQHMVAKLNEEGQAYIVLNGSPLFSGDAGSGESNIRKWLLDNDLVEGFIQLPTGEFFNTGITTYLWCLNKNKSASRKNKIICINAEDECEALKKNIGDKSQQLTKEGIEKVSYLLVNFEESDISKIKSKYEFYFNKQVIKKLIVDGDFGAYLDGKKTTEIEDVVTITISNRDNTELEVKVPDFTALSNKDEAEQFNQFFKDFDNDFQNITVTNNNGENYTLDENHCVIMVKNGETYNLGYGDIVVKATYKKATTKAPEKVVVSVALEPVWEKDEEKIPYSPDDVENENNIWSFMNEWVSTNKEHIQLLNNTIGVEINFNNVFPKKINVRSTAEILAEIADLDKEMAGE